jgi:hypothetical protein
MKHKEIVRELIAVGISLQIREINYNEAVALINKNLEKYKKLVENLALSDVSNRRELLIATLYGWQDYKDQGISIEDYVDEIESNL